ncbi:MAG TPA: twin-arginine translocation signal domain-containing protein, partial [Bryobacteraceae bacterium]|nr:twin-arginine translocation signal domain-containing protein [Bryobacteraceae bacterium]
MNRRNFLQAGASVTAGLMIGFRLPAQTAQSAGEAAPRLNAWIHVGTDDTVTFMIHKSEMGQGTLT